MTLSFGHVRQWRSADLAAAHAALDVQRQALLGLSDELAAARPPGWRGSTADAAQRHLESLTDRIEHIVAEVAAGARAISSVADDVAAVAQLIADADDRAMRNGLKISDNGDIEEIEFNFSDLNIFERIARRNEVGDMVALIMKRAQEIDEYLTSVFDRIVGDRISDGGATNLADANTAGDDEGSLHTYLLNRYQVSVDPEGMVTYPDGALGWILEQAGHSPQRMTKGEADLLDDIGLAGLKDAYDVYRTAIHDSENIYGGQGLTDGHSDAFRHAYWNAMLANRFGQDWAEQYTTAHERVDTNAATAEAMDLHNNEVGRRIAAAHPGAGPEELSRLVDEAVRRGDMVVVGPDGELVRSNEVPMGQTGRAVDPPGQGGPDPAPPKDYNHTSGGYNPGSDGDNYGTYDN